MKDDGRKNSVENPLCRTAAILAGGKGLRMGQDKQTLSRKGQVLVHSLIGQLQAYFDEIIVVTRSAGLYQGQDVLLTRDKLPSRGPMSGIHAALSVAASPYIYLTACDMPLFEPELLKLLLEELNSCQPCSGVAVEREFQSRDGSMRLRPEIFHAIYAKSLLAGLREQVLSQRSKVEHFMRETDFHFLKEKEVRQILPDWSVFTNINTPEEALAAGLDPLTARDYFS
ncbi:MAG: molybdenum cofactor guanylyltransferase [Clostridiaceae bacterium]|nr:molybdenum cofactor guanylyltransferase [Clostridiaceae bacterium]